MKILIDKHDLAKMSVELRNELMQLMFDQEPNISDDFYACSQTFYGIDDAPDVACAII